MKSKIILTLSCLAILFEVSGQSWPACEKLNWLIGEWAGEGSGEPGAGGGTFSFKPDLDQHVLVRKSHSEYPATGNKPEVVHNDLMIVYSGSVGNPLKAIYFDNEGHTIQYSVTSDDNSAVFMSEKLLNGPTFRLTYRLLDEHTVNTSFEISRDGITFKTYLEGKSSRIKDQRFKH